MLAVVLWWIDFLFNLSDGLRQKALNKNSSVSKGHPALHNPVSTHVLASHDYSVNTGGPLNCCLLFSFKHTFHEEIQIQGLSVENYFIWSILGGLKLSWLKPKQIWTQLTQIWTTDSPSWRSPHREWGGTSSCKPFKPLTWTTPRTIYSQTDTNTTTF